jgi:hypothetical protein
MHIPQRVVGILNGIKMLAGSPKVGHFVKINASNKILMILSLNN